MSKVGRILIADDEETFLCSTADLLRREGYECSCAADAASAAARLRSEEYDLLLADIKMPGNPDLELIKDMENIAKGMPVILMTGYPSVNSAIQSIQLPVVAYLVKPLDFDELLRWVQFSVERHSIYRTIEITHNRLQEWSKDLEKVETLMRRPSVNTSPIPISTFLELTIRNIVYALLDLKHLAELAALHEDKQDACHLLECPRPTVLMEALREVISVLEKTKSAFKSKDLGQLRKKLEGLVNMDEK